MKILILTLSLLLGQWSFADNVEDDYLQDNLPIKEHMLMMDLHRDAFFADLNDPKVPAEKTISHLKKLRVHFHRLFPKVPFSLKGRSEEDYNKSRANFQSQILKALNWTIEMERAILKPAKTDQEKERKEQEIRTLSHQLNIIVGKGHREFR